MASQKTLNLQDLQEHLKARLEAAQKEVGTISSWLAVECGDDRFLLPLEQSGEIFPWSGGVQPVPYTHAWFLGVASLRGVLTGVVDISRLLGANPTRSEQALSAANLLTFSHVLEVNAALLIDHLAGLRGVDDFAASEEASSEAPGWFGSVYYDVIGTRWQELNLQALSQDPTFLGIGA